MHKTSVVRVAYTFPDGWTMSVDKYMLVCEWTVVTVYAHACGSKLPFLQCIISYEPP